jgi:photosystem II stability/assembly factor-like uncharacterized protein
VLVVSVLLCTELRAQWQQTPLPHDGAYTFAAVDKTLFTLAYGSVFKTTNNGDVWEYAAQIPDPERLLDFKSDLILTTHFNGIFCSRDAGLTWSQCRDSNLSSSGAAAIIAIGDTRITNTGYNGIFLSSNEGHSWMPLKRFYFDSAIQQFSLNGKYLFAAAKGGVFRASDGGIGWERLTPWMGDTEVNTIASRGSVVVAGTREAGIYRSTNYGGH